MTNSRYKKFIFTLAVLPFVLIGCAQSDSDTVHDAQYCLDKATSSTALTCYSKVNGISTAAASLVRCASILVYEGFGSASKLQSALTGLQGGGSPLSTASAQFAFLADGGSGTAQASDISRASDASTQCAASGSTGLTMLATFASIATVTSSLNSGTITVGTIHSSAGTIVSSVPNSPQLIQTAYQQNCSGNISSSNQSFCTQYQAAQAANPGASSATIATYFLTNLN